MSGVMGEDFDRYGIILQILDTYSIIPLGFNGKIAHM
jgi:hypothetical protein